MSKDTIWEHIQLEAAAVAKKESALSNLLKECVLDRANLEEAISYQLARKLSRHILPEYILREIFFEILMKDRNIIEKIRNDINAVIERDPACNHFLTP